MMMEIKEGKWMNETMRHNYDYGKIDCDHILIAWEIKWMVMVEYTGLYV